MGIEIIGKLTQKNNGDFKLVDLADVDYDGTGKSAKQELENLSSQIKDSVKYETITANEHNQGIQINSPNIYDRDIIYKNMNVPGYALLLNYNMYNSERIRIANNKIISQGADAIELNTPLDETEEQKTLKDVIIANNFLESQGTSNSHNAGFALGIAGTKNVTVTGNVIPYSRQEGLHIEDTQKNISVIGNVFDNNYYRASWIEDRHRNNGDYARVPIIMGNHFTQHENAKRGDGLYTVYNNFGNLKYVNFRNNRFEGFLNGVNPDGASQPDIDGCIFENCTTAIQAKGIVWGDFAVKGDTETLVSFRNNGQIRGTIKTQNVYDPDKIFTFADNCKDALIDGGFSCSLPNIEKVDPVVTQYSRIKICKAPTYMKGIVDMVILMLNMKLN